jgi:phosphopantothenoylcysteine decarboxylase/phosphopantothenate--cysteine ligase
MKVLITAGATREPIDAVRFLSNVSTGRTGAALAEVLSAAGHVVTLLHGEGAVMPKNGCAGERFSSADDLATKLQRQLGGGTYDVIIMAAAVADYRPADPIQGKLSSEQNEQTLRLVRNQKILPRLKSFSPQPLGVVGFKLTVGADESARQAAVAAQFAAGGVDLVVHNDLEEIAQAPREAHPFRLYASSHQAPEELCGVDDLALAIAVIMRFGASGSP